MSSRPRRKQSRHTARAPHLTPVIAVGDLVRIALMQDVIGAVEQMPVKILADGTAEQLTRVESARAMTMLALFARAFAAALDEDTRNAILLQLEAIFEDEVLTEMELHLATDGQES